VTIHIPWREIQNHFDFIENTFLPERMHLRKLYYDHRIPTDKWFLARAVKNKILHELPESTSYARTTKQLFEGDWFEKTNKDKEYTVVLVYQKLVPLKQFNSSKIKPEFQFEEEDERPIKQEPGLRTVKEPHRRTTKPEPKPPTAIKNEPRTAVKNEPRTIIKNEPRTAIKNEPRTAVKGVPRTQNLEPELEPQTPARKRSRTELSWGDDELPEDPVRYCLDRTILSSVPLSLSDRTYTVSRDRSLELTTNEVSTVILTKKSLLRNPY